MEGSYSHGTSTYIAVGDRSMIYSVQRVQGGWNIIDENSKEKTTVRDGSIISFMEGGSSVVETVGEQTKAEHLIRAWKGL
jgi:hypothetical protein